MWVTDGPLVARPVDGEILSQSDFLRLARVRDEAGRGPGMPRSTFAMRAPRSGLRNRSLGHLRTRLGLDDNETLGPPAPAPANSNSEGSCPIVELSPAVFGALLDMHALDQATPTVPGPHRHLRS